jgi:hypothetical protein
MKHGAALNKVLKPVASTEEYGMVSAPEGPQTKFMGYSALHFAALGFFKDLVDGLVRFGADVNLCIVSMAPW